MPWIESHQELRNHPKTKRLARELKISVAAAIGHLHCLWWWATDYAPDGDLTEYEDWEIADAAYYEGKNTAKFKDALIFAGFLDNTEQGRLILHDWNDYAGKNLKQRQKARERTQRYREKQSATSSSQNEDETQETHTKSRKSEITQSECDGNVTHTVRIQNGNETKKCASTGQDITGQDITGHESTGNERTNIPPNPPEGEEAEQDETATLQDRRFEEFWQAYPKKQGKGAARKAWGKIHPNAALHKLILESVKAHAERNPQWQRDNGQYIPNPATWLNQSRWEDETPKATTQQNGGEQRNDGGHADPDTGSGFRRSTGFRRADTDTDHDN